MEKRILFLLFFTISYSVFCQYTAIPDSVFEDFLESNGMGDGVPNNGQVLTANINTVTTLDLPSFAGITDMTGIEDFIAVEFLDFSYNQVTSIDLSQNINLKIFGCGFNNISSLNLSNNTQIEWVYAPVNPSLSSLLLNSNALYNLEVWECNLSTLDLSQCPNLDFLDCHINQLSVLNITQCTSLTQLIAWSNQLATLDLSQNSLLDVLRLSYNNFNTINLSQNTELRIFSLSYNNNFTYLDISNNYNLISFGCIQNPNIEYIDIRNGSNESIINFDSRNNTNSLGCIFVDDTSAIYLDDWNINSTSTFVNNEAECEALSTESFTDNTFRVYPNPANEFIIVSIHNPATFTLIDANGKHLKIGELTIGLNSISLRGISNGIYFLRIDTVKGFSTKKIILK